MYAPPFTILLVDDDEADRYATARSLKAAGYRVISVPDHEAALGALDGSEPIAVLVTDIVMPGKANGFALARMARLRRPLLKIIYVTAYADDLARKSPELMLGPMLEKPFPADRLVAAIEQSLAPDGLDPNKPSQRRSPHAD
jgi:CheY-like chemotaxis protein